MIHLPRSSYTIKPWKNGLGTTEEVYVYPPGNEDFLFRVSLATLSTSGPFSLFPGIDRSLILLEGKPVRLNDLLVPLLAPVSFPGEEKIEATVEAQGRDLNLMCRREKVSGKIETLSGDAAFPQDAVFCVIFSLSDSVTVGAVELRKFDSCVLDNSDRRIAIRGGNYLRILIRQK
jgi:environmental stress-induced protein Ves